ncbi:MAG: hypothetical protein Q9157_006682 [Trypethelium eluteriae]
MISLSAELQGVLERLPDHISQSLGSGGYRHIIQSHAESLDTIGRDAEKTTAKTRAQLTCKASSILFTGFIKPLNSIEVALSLKIITYTQSRFAIRSAGHNANPGFSSTGEEGVVLDLGALNTVELSSEREIVSLGPGATWEKVYEELEKYELTVVGGRVSGVGVGGLILGGGMSHFSNHWGLVCDNVKNFEVVLADSSIAHANAIENPQLFRALKGGGSNFGVVTKFDLYTYPDYRVWYTFKVYNASDSERVIKASERVQKAMDEDDRIGFFLVTNSAFLVAGMLYMGWPEETPGIFRVFEDIKPMMDAVPETKGTQLSVIQAFDMSEEGKRESGTATTRPDADLYLELHKVLQDIAKSAAVTLQFTFQPIGKAAVNKGNEYGGNCLNIPRENQSWLAMMVQWNDDANDGEARSQISQLISSLKSTCKTRGHLLDFHFMNDCSYTQSPFQGYGKENLAFLKATAAEWDLQGVFQKLQSSGFLLSKM